MLKWLCSIAKKRIARGRLVLMENGQTSRAWNLKCFEELEGLLDGLQSNASFEYGIGDQCSMGQRDREPGDQCEDAPSGAQMWRYREAEYQSDVGAMNINKSWARINSD